MFALINRPEIFDLRPGSSFVEFLLAEGFDVFLVDWGVPDDEDSDMGLDEYVCDELHWAVRETLRASRRRRGDADGLVHRRRRCARCTAALSTRRGRSATPCC